MNYIGRKYSLLGFLEQGITSFVDSDARKIFDIFAGTGTVGWHFKQIRFSIVANDIQYYAYCLNRAYVGLNRAPAFSKLRRSLGLPHSGRGGDHVLRVLNETRPRAGFVFRNYCSGGSSEPLRFYFSDDNGKRCDSVRQQIETWHRNDLLNGSEYYYLLASLIVAVDKVANTASVYAAYLKKLKASARKPFVLKAVPTSGGNGRHTVHNRDGSDLIGKISCDILYMDPPYNQRQYCTNYHVLETIARYDKPKLSGLTGLRPYENQRSDFCIKRKALGALEEMVRRTRARYVFLSYSSEGLMARRDILDLMRTYGEVDVRSKEYPRFRADVDGKNRKYKANSVTEYLFRLKKQ